MADARIVLSAEDRASRVLQGLRREMSTMEGGVATLRGALGAIGPAFGAAFSVAGVLGLTKSVVNGLDKLNDLADATGASVENLSALEDIAERTGTSVDTMGDAIVKMNKALADAKPGSDQAAVFNALGLSIAELQALDPVESFQKLAIALQGVTNDGAKARYVQELFSKSLREVAPLLKDTAEAGKLIATVTAKQAEEAERLNKEFFALEKNAKDLGRTLAGPVIEALNQVLGAFSDSGRAVGELTGAAAAAAVPFQTLAVLGVETAFVFRGVGTEIGGIVAQMAALGRGDLSGFSAIGKAMKEDAAAARKEVDALTSRIMNVGGAENDARRRAEDRGFRPPGQSLRELVGGSKARGGSAKPFLRDGPIMDPELAFRVSEANAKASVEEALRLDKLNDMTKERADALRLVSEEQARLNDLLDATPAGKLKQAQEDMLLLADAFEKGRISAEEFEQAASTRLGNVAEVAKSATDEWSVFADQAARNIQDVLGNTLEATLSGHFDGIGQMWKNMLIRMASEAAAAQLGKALFGDFGGKGGGSLGGLAGLLLSELPAFATGTPYVPQDMIAMVHKGERIIPASKNTANGAPGAAPMVFHNTYNVGAGVPLSQVVAVVQAGNRTLEAKILRSRRRDGAFAS